MKRFPEDVRSSMERGGASVTCVPVRLDEGAWESAVFFQLSGSESKGDRRLLTRAKNPVPLEIETDLIAHDSATIVILRFEVHTVVEDPLVGEVLLTPGHSEHHHQVLSLFGSQPRLCWFFSDQKYWVIHSQQHPLGQEHHAVFKDLQSDALRKDAMIRLTGRYDAQVALGSVLSRYELRAGSRSYVQGDVPGSQFEQ